MTLDQELKYFSEHRDELLKACGGQFVLVKGATLVGAFTTEQEAYRAGLEKFGNEAFLIKKVAPEEEVAHFPALVLGLVNASS